MMSMYMIYVHSHLINNVAFHGSNISIYIDMYCRNDESFGTFDLFKNKIDKTKKMASPVQYRN